MTDAPDIFPVVGDIHVERGGEGFRLIPLGFEDHRAIAQGLPIESAGPGYPTQGDIIVAEMAMRSFAAGVTEPPPVWAVVDTESGLLCGGIGVTGMRTSGRSRGGVDDEWEAEVGYGLAPWARGRGLATRALGLLVEVLRDSTAVSSVMATCDTGNEASAKVLLRNGFVEEDSGDIGLRQFRKPITPARREGPAASPGG